MHFCFFETPICHCCGWINSEMKGIVVKSASVQKVLPISTYCGGCARLSRFFRSSIVVGLVLLRTKRTLAMPSYSSYYTSQQQYLTSDCKRELGLWNGRLPLPLCSPNQTRATGRCTVGPNRKTRQKLDWKIRENDWLYLCLLRFDEF